MGRLKQEFCDFVRLWNAHSIRKQKTREHVVPGKPHVLYHTPQDTGGIDCKVPLDQARWDTIQKVFAQDPIQLDEYLPKMTMDICHQIMDELGGLPVLQEKEYQKTPWFPQYCSLRKRLHLYEQDHPGSLSLLPSPTGSLYRVKDFFREQGIDLDNLDDRIEEDMEI
jgi:hypothetical protein